MLSQQELELSRQLEQLRISGYHHAEAIAAAGLVGLVMTASKPLMIYHGARAEGVSTNPIAIAAPSSDPARPLLFDMSTASVAAGKIKLSGNPMKLAELMGLMDEFPRMFEIVEPKRAPVR